MVRGAPGVGAERRGRLQAGSAALGVPLTEPQTDTLLAYLGLLERWNKVHNLSAVRDLDSMVTQHLLDCLAVVGPLRRHAAGRALRILDVGSGAGLPGLVWSVAEPDWTVTTIDAVAKKVAFVRAAVGELQLANLTPLHARVEAAPVTAGFDVVASRAFASLGDFVALTRGRLAADGVWLAMKAGPPHDEIAALAPDLEVFHVEHLQVPGLAARRCLVWIREC
jgi:16S rRNA (guanine527-N7)-methyltransferase